MKLKYFVIAECIVRMLNLNQPTNASGTANEEVYKILIYT